jgi:CBS-domain-containing membrane protein
MSRLRLIDERFREDPVHYVLQTLLAFVVIALIVVGMGVLTSGTIVAALGASSFIVFAMPHYKPARPRNLIGGHVVCLALGLLCSIPVRTIPGLTDHEVGLGLIAAAAVALSIFAMVVTDSEHPPAAGNALAFAITSVGLGDVLFTLGAVVLLAIVRHALRGWLRDLA